MKCPKCGAWTQVLSSRKSRRMRECGNLHRFATVEILATESEYMAHRQRIDEARRILRKKGYLR